MKYVFLLLILLANLGCQNGFQAISPIVPSAKFGFGACYGGLTVRLNFNRVFPQKIRVEWFNYVYDECTGQGFNSSALNIYTIGSQLVLDGTGPGVVAPQHLNLRVMDLGTCSMSYTVFEQSNYRLLSSPAAACDSYDISFDVN